MSPYGAVRCVLTRGGGGGGGGYYAESAGSISFVHASSGRHSGVVDDPVVPGHDTAVLGNFFYRRFGEDGTTFEVSGTSIWRRITDERRPHFNRCLFKDDFTV